MESASRQMYPPSLFAKIHDLTCGTTCVVLLYRAQAMYAITCVCLQELCLMGLCPDTTFIMSTGDHAQRVKFAMQLTATSTQECSLESGKKYSDGAC